MDSIMKKTAFIIGLISLLTACNSGSDDRFMELPDTPAGKASISFDGARTRASLNILYRVPLLFTESQRMPAILRSFSIIRR